MTRDLLDEVALCAAAAGMEEPQVRELAAFAAQRGERLIDSLVARAGADEAALATGLARLLDLPLLDHELAEIPHNTLAQIPPTLAVSHQVIPLGHEDGRLRVACWDPFDWQGWDDLAYLIGRPLEKVLCPRSLIVRMINSNYGLGADTVARLVTTDTRQSAATTTQSVTDLSDKEAANEPTVVNLVNRILTEAIGSNATDIHFEPHEGRYRIRYRIDGMLEDVPTPPNIHALRLAVASRIKIMSGLDITEKRLPQDGRARVALTGQNCDLRISVLPGIHGEAVVIRIQNQQAVQLDLAALGFEDYERQVIDRLISRSHGLFLVTGPTGSGKTTTLYTCLLKVRCPRIKILTIEDPVEYWIDDVLQMQVHEEIGFSFATALRSMLRHDPDVMLVGEIRDLETAEIAIRSALTGHLVLASLHTNDAASAVTRLCDIGIEPFLVASSVQGILAQRLARRVCPHCQEEVLPDSFDEFTRAMLHSLPLVENTSLLRGKGCERCRFTGYRGRMAVGEAMMVSAAIRRLIQQRESADALKETACREGMRLLRDNALRAVAGGKTTIPEVLRVTQEEL
jgi:general secretion pathway protein E/type IV pilus assembly protein PilB